MNTRIKNLSRVPIFFIIFAMRIFCVKKLSSWASWHEEWRMEKIIYQILLFIIIHSSSQFFSLLYIWLPIFLNFSIFPNIVLAWLLCSYSAEYCANNYFFAFFFAKKLNFFAKKIISFGMKQSKGESFSLKERYVLRIGFIV